MMAVAKLAIIGGSGLDNLALSNEIEPIFQDTPYGSHSAPIMMGRLLIENDSSSTNVSQTDQIIFLPRHGADHKVPPHLVNYRANIWALKQLGVERILACSVVGGISQLMSPGTFVIPNQIVDYTYGREHTFFDGTNQDLCHVDFTEPYSKTLRQRLLTYFNGCELPYQSEVVYGCTQGPRLETAAEIKRMRNDRCDVVGMTAMPEAVLAREMGMEYVGLSLVVNWAAGVKEGISSIDEITKTIGTGMQRLTSCLPELIRSLISTAC